MSHFEYIMVMVAIILGLGLTLALRGVSRLIRSPRREPAVVIWAFFLVFLFLQNWWAFWDLSAIEEWNFFRFMLLALYVCNLYAMTELLLPMASTPETDWRLHFLKIRKWYYGMTVLLAMQAVFLTWYVSGIPFLHPYRIMQVSILALAVTGWITPNLVAHRWIAALVLAALFTGQLVFRLLPGLAG